MMVAHFLEASVNFQTKDIWEMYAGIAIFLYGIMFINYKRACKKNK